MNQKIIVVGTSGAGKSTLARTLSKKFNMPHIEMDHLYWGKNWSVNPDFRERLEQQLQIPHLWQLFESNKKYYLDPSQYYRMARLPFLSGVLARLKKRCFWDIVCFCRIKKISFFYFLSFLNYLV